jgi:hypothetical protein
MGQGTTRVVEGNGAGDRVRELGDEITDLRRRLDALVVELDRRRHRVTSVPRRLRQPGAGLVAGVLAVAVLAVVAPMMLARRRASRVGALARHGTELRDKARSLGQALGRIAHDPDQLAPPRPPVIGTNTLVAIGLTAAQILARRFLLAPGARV